MAKGAGRGQSHTKNLRPLSLAFLDVKKAFDSVNHSTTLIACKRIGIPAMLLQYIRDLYKKSETQLRVQQQLSTPIEVNRGIRQGDLLSVPLFLAVMDLATSVLDPNIGVSMGKAKLNHLAFADDLVILYSTADGLQKNLDNVLSNLGCSGLELNPVKCATFQLKIDGEKKKWTINPEPFLDCKGTKVPSTTVTSFYKYLGIKVGVMSNSGLISDNLEKKLHTATKAPLKPQQRLYALDIHLIPSLLHPLTFMSTTKKFLKSIDLRIRAAVRGWLKIPKGLPNSFFLH